MSEPETTPRPGPAPPRASLRPRTAAISCPTSAASGQCCGVARVLSRALVLLCPSETSRGRWCGPQPMGRYGCGLRPPWRAREPGDAVERLLGNGAVGPAPRAGRGGTSGQEAPERV